MDWLLRHLADRLGVEPARAGEAIAPQIRFEQPWPQGVTLLVVLGCAGADRLALPPRGPGLAALQDGPGRAPDRAGPAGGVHALRGGALGRADRPALLRRDGRRLGQRGQIVDQFANPKTKAAASWPTLSGRPEPSRLAVAQGLLAQDDGHAPPRAAEAEQGAALPRLDARAGCWPRSTSPRTSTPALDEAPQGRGRPAARPGSATGSARS